MKRTNGEIAKRLKDLLEASSPLMEQYTAITCPNCRDVCCRQKHGLYRPKDILYLESLGVAIPDRDEKRNHEGPCEAMGPFGCVHPRWLRPFKCTWYFCDPLLAVLNASPPKNARRISAILQEMSDLYAELV